MAPFSSSNVIPINALISFHSQERSLFKRLVIEMGTNHVLAMGVIAFWMWLESIGHPSFIQNMATMSIERIRCIVVEGETCLTAILIDASDPLAVAAKREVLTTSEVPGSPIDLRYFHYFWESARDGVTSILNNICPMIFKDLLTYISSMRISHGSREDVDRMFIDTTKEGNGIMRATNISRTQNESGILGPYNGRRTRSHLLYQSRSSLTNEGVVMPLKDDAPFVPYGEGSSRDPHLSSEIPLYREGSNAQKGCQEMLVPTNWLLFSMLNTQPRIQPNSLWTSPSQSFKMSFQDFGGERDIGGLFISPRAVISIGGGVDQVLELSSHMESVVTSLSSYSLIHQRPNSKSMALTLSTVNEDIPQDERTLFITFSNGYPLGERDLHEFFTRHYGGIEMIHVQKVEPGEQPLYARITFYLQATCLIVLNGNERAKFVIKGKHVWARHYVPKRKRRAGGEK